MTEQLEGVVGNVQVLTLPSLTSVTTTDFPSAVVTDVSISPNGKFVAFVKDYTELWIIDIMLGQTRRLTTASALAPTTLGSVLMAPTFTRDSGNVLMVVVEKTFEGGEDDKLDNIWRVSLAGTASKQTNLTEGTKAEDWLIVRQPISLPDGGLMYSRADSGGQVAGDSTDPRPFYAVGVHDPNGHLKTITEVPPMTIALAADRTRIFFFSYDNYTQKWDLRVMNVGDSQSSWTYCEPACEMVAEDIDWASVGLAE